METFLKLLLAGTIIIVSTKIILSRMKIGRQMKTQENNEFILKNPSFVTWSGNKYSIIGLVAIWLFSLALPGITTNTTSTLGIGILVTGMLGPLQGILSWYANPCAFFAIRYLTKYKYKEALFFSIASILLGLQAFMFQGRNITYIDSDGPFGILAFGYYVWMLFLVLLFILCVFNFTRTKKTLN